MVIRDTSVTIGQSDILVNPSAARDTSKIAIIGHAGKEKPRTTERVSKETSK